MEVLISTEYIFARYGTLSQLQPVNRLDNISIRIYLSDHKKSGQIFEEDKMKLSVPV